MLYLICFSVYYMIYNYHLMLVNTMVRSNGYSVMGGIAYLNDPDSYADWSFHTPGSASQVRQVE